MVETQPATATATGAYLSFSFVSCFLCSRHKKPARGSCKLAEMERDWGSRKKDENMHMSKTLANLDCEW
jgi:hypothetical protein